MYRIDKKLKQSYINRALKGESIRKLTEELVDKKLIPNKPYLVKYISNTTKKTKVYKYKGSQNVLNGWVNKAKRKEKIKNESKAK